MDLVASGLRSGLSVVDALACASAVGGDPSAYLSAVVARLRVGLPAQLAWDRPPPPLLPLARAMVLADLSGAPAAAVVARAADDARAQMRERVEQAAARLGVRLVLPLGLAVLPGFVLLAVVPTVLGLAASVLHQAG
jgi:pilus assembly protein TadC